MRTQHARLARPSVALAATLCAAAAVGVRVADAAPQLQYVWSCAGNTAGCGGTVVFIHGKADCGSAMGDCNGGDATSGPVAYWTNRSNNHNMLDEATTRYVSGGVVYYEAFAVGYDLEHQSLASAAADVGTCLQDLYQGSNQSGCNPSRYQRTQFSLVTHSAGGTVVDRLMSTGWYGVRDHVRGSVVELAPALAGSRASSALYGIDGYSNFCTSLVSWLAGWALKDGGAASMTRSAVMAEANKGYAGRSSGWQLKVTTSGGCGSANNNGAFCGTSVNEHDNDGNMGTLVGCLGYSSSDDTDGLLYWSDSNPTSNTGGNGCPSGDHSCHYYPQFSGAYWHWFETWANHSHSRDDAYTTRGDWQSTSGCYTRSPGTCVGQYGLP